MLLRMPFSEVLEFADDDIFRRRGPESSFGGEIDAFPARKASGLKLVGPMHVAIGLEAGRVVDDVEVPATGTMTFDL